MDGMTIGDVARSRIEGIERPWALRMRSAT